MENLIKKMLVILVVAAFAVELPSCKKGDTGPQGAEGPAGINGTNGTNGANGTNGTDGNANVQAYTYNLSNAVWTTVGTVNSGYLQLDIAAPNALTSTVIGNSVILVYIKSSDYADWALLPYYTDRDIRVQAEVSVGRVRLKRDQAGRPSTQSNFQSLRVVVVRKTDEKPLSIAPQNLDRLQVKALN